ncbi:MAG: (2Fe-2S) ferredoxin domain-containing protein [Bacillota bacterium]
MKSLDELAKIREDAKKLTGLREGSQNIKIVIGMATCGIAAGARDTMMAFLDELGKRNIQDVAITQTGCIGLCEQEPLVEVYVPGKDKVVYGKVTADRARQIVANHIVNGNVVNEWVIKTN